MNISSFAGSINPFVKNNIQTKKQNNTSFKSIFINSSVVASQETRNEPLYSFLPKNALALNKISYSYPNQDCFITKGHSDRPALLFREKPPKVAVYSDTPFREISVKFDKDEQPYEPIPLILYPLDDYELDDYFLNDYKFINLFIGLCSSSSPTPSLELTVKSGYELHKKLIERKYKIEDKIGNSDMVDFGGPTILDKSHKAIEEDEIAVTRFLMECAYLFFAERAEGNKFHGNTYLRTLVELIEERKYDLTTSLAKQMKNSKSSELDKFDICDIATKSFPNIQENKARIKELAEYMRENEMGFY